MRKLGVTTEKRGEGGEKDYADKLKLGLKRKGKEDVVDGGGVGRWKKGIRVSTPANLPQLAGENGGIIKEYK